MAGIDTFIEACLVRSGRARAVGGADPFHDVEWLATVARCNADFVGPALWTAMREAGKAALLPADLQSYLELLHTENARRNAAIREQCIHLGQVLAGTEVEAVLLKGAAWLFQDGPAQADRMLRDIDVLVAPEALEAALEALTAAGYRPLDGIVIEHGHIHAPPLMHPDHRVSLEVHVEVTTRPSMLPAHEVIAASMPVHAGLRLPSVEHRIVHNVLHAQISNGDFAGGVVSLRDALDLARLLGAADAVDWPAALANARSRGYSRQLSGALHKAALFAGASLPPVIAADRRGARHAWRCALQRRNRLADWLLPQWGKLSRALAWERDAYALGLGDDHGPRAQLQVNRRRLERTLGALRRRIGRS